MEFSNYDFLNVLITGVFKDDKLMCDNSVGYLLFFGLVQLISCWNLMDLYFATVLLLLLLIQNLCNVHLLLAARVLVIRSHGSIQGHFDFRRLFMQMAVAHFRNMVVQIAFFTLKNLQIWPNLPVDFSPRDPIRLSYKGHELLKIPGSINDVFGSNLTVIINVSFAFRAMENFPLTHSEEFVAESAFIQIVPFLF